jgi:hypothetical protein
VGPEYRHAHRVGHGIEREFRARSRGHRFPDSTADGHFHFAQVDMSIDFDLWAEKDGKKSAIKTVSSWDARKDFISDLKLK